MPWLGFFFKLASADFFVLLDDVQFSKGSYTNRVRISRSGQAHWLTQPVKVSLGEKILDVEFAKQDWRRSHIDALRNAYGLTSGANGIGRDLEELYDDLPCENLAVANRTLIERSAARLGLSTRIVNASTLGHFDKSGYKRLIALTRECSATATYLSGMGGAKYQDPSEFAAAGLGFRYGMFEHPVYKQGGGPFIPGLSVLDAALRLGWRETGKLIQQQVTRQAAALGAV